MNNTSNNNINKNNNDNEYFVVSDRNICTLLKKMTQQFYYVFTTKNGTETYSFKRTDKVILAYKLIVKAKEIGILNM